MPVKCSKHYVIVCKFGYQLKIWGTTPIFFNQKFIKIELSFYLSFAPSSLPISINFTSFSSKEFKFIGCNKIGIIPG